MILLFYKLSEFHLVFIVQSLDPSFLAVLTLQSNNKQTNTKRYSLQTDILNQLSTKIESQLSTLTNRLSTLPRSEATPLRSTHVKLSRDYQLVLSRYKNVVMDVKKKKSLEIREERRREEDKRGEENEEEMEVRRQMLIQQDVSKCFKCWVLLSFGLQP